MRFPIGAMSVGDILDRGLKVLLGRLPTFYVIYLLAVAPYLLVALLSPAIGMGNFEPAGGEGGAPGGAAVALLGGFLLMLAMLLILNQFATAAILHVIAQEFIDQRVGVGEAFGFAFGRFGRLLGASVLAGLIIFLGFFPGCILLGIPGIIFMVWYIFVGQVVVVEGKGGMDALSRSKELTAGFRWRVFGVLLLTLIIIVILQVAVSRLEVVLPYRQIVRNALGGFTQVLTNYRNYVINTVVLQLANVLVYAYQAVCMTLLYFDLRIRKEGYDLELAAQQYAAGPS